MTRRVNDVNEQIAIPNGRILGHDSNAALTLQIDVVERTLLHALISTKHTALMQHRIHQGRLAVVHVRDDGDVAPERIGNTGNRSCPHDGLHSQGRITS